MVDGKLVAAAEEEHFFPISDQGLPAVGLEGLPAMSVAGTFG